jgi:hypothetical protein
MYEDMLEDARDYMSPSEIRELETEFRNRRILSDIGAKLVRDFCHSRQDEVSYIRNRMMKPGG